MASFARGGEISPSLLLRRSLGTKANADIPSAPTYTDVVAGSLFTNANFRKIMDTLRNAADLRKARPKSCVWLVPQIAAWGTTRALPVMLDQITDRLGVDDQQSSEDEALRSIALWREGRQTIFARRSTSSSPDMTWRPSRRDSKYC
ncbi:hypothetical protein IVB33_23385 [Bradyrhizobium sp. 24]|uniref:hypothetical protein n=1 Tax=unclassified Bradyrhizobium TaxID=2631580 RepID=UPI001FF89E69|nr:MULTISPECIES: hypothetical protein [unclassified Bradyrhizobium]MCK1301215.1 hypothetical protein [Bradyrhizobium sp. 37]MCK1380205.1 hypothetical protein [Bradyrhizobium sp. 24]MCK1774209.1 hypothetical protein [Bradyrhizobium sp. 134]